MMSFNRIKIFKTYEHIFSKWIILVEQQKSILLSQDYRKDSTEIKRIFPLNSCSRNFLADPNKNPNEPQPHHQCTIHLNSESMVDLQTAYQQALSGKPSENPLIEMVFAYLLAFPRKQTSLISGYSFLTRSDNSTEKRSCSALIHPIHSLSFTER